MPILRTAFVVTSILWTAAGLGLSARQIAHVRRHRERVPAEFTATVTPEDHRKAADYTVAREKLSALRAVVSLVMALLWVCGGINLLYGELARALPPSPSLGVAFLIAMFAIEAILSLPLSLYGTFVLEEKFGFNRTSPATFVIDKLKSCLIGLIVAVPLLYICLWAMNNLAGLWWLWTWCGLVVLMLTAPAVYIRLIAPRFNQFTALPSGDLRDRVETLMTRCGFKSSGLFTMDASRRSAHGNAYFIGFGNTKRVVLFDTLIAANTPDEIEAVVAHELGHYRHKHVLFGLLRGAAMTFGMLAAFGWLSKQPWLLPSFGFVYQDEALALNACLLLAAMISPILGPFGNWISRRNEFQADSFARVHTGAAPMISALLKLSRDNASTLTPDELYALVHYSHPPVPIRIRHLQEADA